MVNNIHYSPFLIGTIKCFATWPSFEKKASVPRATQPYSKQVLINKMCNCIYIKQ